MMGCQEKGCCMETLIFLKKLVFLAYAIFRIPIAAILPDENCHYHSETVTLQAINFLC